jgi:hypothetical protein
MKITKERINRQGKRIATVELDDGEHIMAVRQEAYYKTGYPQEDVVGGYILLDSVRVTWCSLGQEWVS